MTQYSRFPLSTFPNRQPHQFAFGDARLRTKPDQGPSRVRPGLSRSANSVSLEFTLDAGERAQFWSWFDRDINYGALLFIIPDYTRHGWPLGDETGNVLTDEAGNPLVMVAETLCLFDQLPSERVIGVDFILAFSLMVMPL